MRVYGFEGKENFNDNSCAKCGEAITNPLDKQTIKDLLLVTKEFVTRKVSYRHAQDVVKKAKERIDWEKENMGIEKKESYLCRFCVLNIANLYIKKVNNEFQQEIIGSYNFE